MCNLRLNQQVGHYNTEQMRWTSFAVKPKTYSSCLCRVVEVTWRSSGDFCWNSVNNQSQMTNHVTTIDVRALYSTHFHPKDKISILNQVLVCSVWQVLYTSHILVLKAQSLPKLKNEVLFDLVAASLCERQDEPVHTFHFSVRAQWINTPCTCTASHFAFF